MKHVIFLLFILLAFDCYAGRETIDSLANALGSAPQKNKPAILLEISQEYRKIDPGQALEYSRKSLETAREIHDKNAEIVALTEIGINYALLSKTQEALYNLQEALKLSTDAGDKKRMAVCYNAMGNVQKVQGNIVEALDYYTKALEIRKSLNDITGLTSSYNNLGLIYYSKGMIDKALEYYEKSLENANKLGDEALKSAAYQNIGNVYYQMKKIDHAREMFLQSLRIKMALGDEIGVATIYSNLGNIYFSEKDYPKALEYYEKTLTSALKINNLMTVASTYNNIGLVYYNKPDYKKGKQYFEKSLDLAEKLGNKYLLVSVLNNLGDYYYRVKDYAKSIELLQRSEKISLQQGYRLILQQNYLILAGAFERQGNFMKALEYCNLLRMLNDTLYATQSAEKLAEVEARYQIEKKEKENIILRKTKEQQDTLLFSLIVLIGLLVISVIAIYSRFVNKKRLSRLLERKNDELAAANSSKDRYLEIINNELLQASNYVKSLLPKRLSNGVLKTDYIFIPSEQLGGDMFGYHWIDQNHFAFYLFDVSGHGVGAALHSVSILNSLKLQNLPNTDFLQPDQVLSSLSHAYRMKEHNYYFFTIWYGIYNKQTLELNYATGGHPPALLIREDGTSEKLSSGNIMIGAFDDFKFTSNKKKVDSHSKLYVFSDGTYEIKLQSGEFWQLENLFSMVEGLHTEDAGDIQAVYTNAKALRSSDQLDDDFSILKVTF